MGGDSGATAPPSPIDWGEDRESPSIWEPEQRRSPRWWVLPVVLALVGAGLVAALATRGGNGRSTGRAPVVSPLVATVTSAAKVELSWSGAEGAVEYEIFRDGESLTRVRAPSTTYSDISVLPEVTYEYGVEAVDASGRHSRPAMVTVTTPPPPPLSEARLEGSWEVGLTIVEENYTNRRRGDQFTETWEFLSQCDEGSCDVRVDLFYQEQKQTILERQGETYRGEVEAKLDRCEGELLVTTIALNITVTEAEFVAGAWRATRFTGTYETSSAAALGCNAGHGLMDMVGEPG
jgi:hypothetical protein